MRPILIFLFLVLTVSRHTQKWYFLSFTDVVIWIDLREANRPLSLLFQSPVVSISTYAITGQDENCASCSSTRPSALGTCLSCNVGYNLAADNTCWTAVSCWDVKIRNSFAASGLYYIKPVAASPAFQAYCEFVSDITSSSSSSIWLYNFPRIKTIRVLFRNLKVGANK